MASYKRIMDYNDLIDGEGIKLLQSEIEMKRNQR